MSINEAVWDRVLRVVVGGLLLYLGWSGQVTGGLGTFLKWFGFLPLLTGVIGYCPAYTAFKVRTKKS